MLALKRCGNIARSPARWIMGAVLLMGLVSISAPAQASDGRIVFKGQLFLGSGADKRTDVTGWVDPATQKEYAIVGDSNRKVYIVDVSEPQNPVLVSTINSAPAFDLKTWGNYLYLVDGDGVNNDSRIYDLSNPAAPVAVGTFLSAHNITIDGRGIMYKEVTGLAILNVAANPTSPVALWNDGKVDGHDATVVGDMLYDFHGALGTFIYNVANPAAPVLLGSITNPNEGGVRYHHSGGPTSDGAYLLINDELHDRTDADITVWDISDPATPTLAGSFTDPRATIHNGYVIGSYYFTSFYVAGFRVFDISIPQAIRIVDEFDTAPELSGNRKFDGAFGCYPFAPSGNIYVSDAQNGLFIFSFEFPATITAFDGSYAGGGVTLEWSIEGAQELRGFHVYRSLQKEGGFNPVNESMISPTEVSFTDHTTRPLTRYWYRLAVIDRECEVFSAPITVTTPAGWLALHQNFPNPFNQGTTITFDLPADADVRLDILDASGRKVRTLVDEFRSAGSHTIIWDGSDRERRPLPSGVYFSRLNAGGQIETQRMVIVK